VRARRRFGQHFLLPAWTGRVLDSAAFGPRDRLIEIGPGRGALTLPLSSQVDAIVAVEIDRDLVAGLRERAPGNVRVIEGDFLDVAAATLFPSGDEGRWRAVGNLPYNVSSPILFRLLELSRSTGRLRDATLMLQREVADRIASPPGSKQYGVLSIMVQLDADVHPLLTLPPGAFRPAPQVWSKVIRLTFRPPTVAIADRRRFEVLVRSLFAQRRKKVSNSLQPLAASLGVDAAESLRLAGVDPSCRPETLHLVELARLADVLGAGAAPCVV
jgi:16S rRNA (adenine1518-N6/adenine1519-N6)-dimethyltransferase